MEDKPTVFKSMAEGKDTGLVVLDVYRVLEVTRKYTGFSEKHRNNG